MTTTRKWTALTVVAVLVVALAGWFLLISPKRGEASDLRAQTASQVSANDQLRVKIATLKKQAEDIPEQKALLASIKRQLPDNPALPSLVRDLTAVAKKGNVHLVSMAPGTATAMQLAVQTNGKPVTAASKTGTTGAKSAPAPTLYQITVNLQVEGSYDDVQRFLSGAESLERKMLITSINLTPKDKADSKSGASNKSAKHPNLGATVVGQVYVSPELGVVDPATVAAATTANSSTAK